jgi:hypothetical protein
MLHAYLLFTSQLAEVADQLPAATGTPHEPSSSSFSSSSSSAPQGRCPTPWEADNPSLRLYLRQVWAPLLARAAAEARRGISLGRLEASHAAAAAALADSERASC